MPEQSLKDRFAHLQPYLDKQAKLHPRTPDRDLTGLSAIVTGGNTGLGYEICAHLLRMNVATLVLTSRSQGRAEEAKISLSKRYPEFKGTILPRVLDLSSFNDVKSFAEKSNSELDRLDIVILNAGRAVAQFAETQDGYEETLQVNVISTGLLALLLLPKLSQAKGTAGQIFKPHLSIVASDAHEWAALKPMDNVIGQLKSKAGFNTNLGDPSSTYGVTKMLDVMIARELAKIPGAASVVVNSSNPGLCVSELRRDMPEAIQKQMNEMAWPTEKGARALVSAAVTDTSPGAYFTVNNESEPSEFVRSNDGQVLQEQVFEELKIIWVELEPSVKSLL